MSSFLDGTSAATVAYRRRSGDNSAPSGLIRCWDVGGVSLETSGGLAWDGLVHRGTIALIPSVVNATPNPTPFAGGAASVPSICKRRVSPMLRVTIGSLRISL